MFEQYDTPPHQVGIIDFTHSLNGPQEVATFFAPDTLEQAVEFSDLLVLVAPPEDWLCRHQNQLVKANACVVLSQGRRMIIFRSTCSSIDQSSGKLIRFDCVLRCKRVHSGDLDQPLFCYGPETLA